MPDTQPEDLIRQLRSLAEDFADVHHLTLATGSSTIAATAAGRSAIEHLTGAARQGNDAGGYLLAGIPAATALHRAPRSTPRPARTPRNSIHHLALRRHLSAATGLLRDAPVICLDAAALITAATSSTALVPGDVLPRLTDPQLAAFRLISQRAVRIRQREGRPPFLHTSVPAPTVTATVAALERKKLVTRDTGTSLDEGQELVLTPAGTRESPARLLRAPGTEAQRTGTTDNYRKEGRWPGRNLSHSYQRPR
ncbi:hypothetical protein [Streptomyces niveus]|uniref:hypothetical protein n=1 Tax=Streptomyces niveus TaxID=193462 RepID=UPI001331917A|nr:hypothetical protein [Streptomyces niveus]